MVAEASGGGVILPRRSMGTTGGRAKESFRVGSAPSAPYSWALPQPSRTSPTRKHHHVRATKVQIPVHPAKNPIWCVCLALEGS